MTREEALAAYHPIRASVRHILSAAISACNQSDFMRAAKQLGLWAEETISLPEGDQAAEMLGDIAFFEPNQRGRRTFDVFLAAKARQLDAADFALAQRMGDAFFSLFRFSARHEVEGVWLWPAIGGSGSWTRAWRRPLRKMSLSACAFSTLASFMLGSGSPRRRTTRRPSSALKV
jgi:hypothetical protein